MYVYMLCVLDLKIKQFLIIFSPSSAPESRADFLLSPDEVLNLNFIGALPNKAITKIRVHWVLDLVRVRYIE